MPSRFHGPDQDEILPVAEEDRIARFRKEDINRSIRTLGYIPLGVLSMLAILAFIIILIVKPWNREKRSVEANGEKLNSLVYSTLTGVQVFDRDGLQFVFEAPETRGYVSQDTKGIVLLLHRCGRSSLNFWDRSAECEKCRGLPVELELTAMALEKGYISLAVSSSDQRSKCWMDMKDQVESGERRDFDNIKVALKAVREALTTRGDRTYEQDRVLRNVIVFGLGSGGYFGSVLPIVDGIGSSIQGLILQSSDVSQWAVRSLMPGSFPPIAFIHMHRPKASVADTMQDQWTLSELKATTKNFLVDENAFTVEFCKHEIERVGDLCEDLVDDLVEANVIDEHGKYLQDPQSNKSAWEKAASSVGNQIGPSSITGDSGVMEIVDVAQGYQEATPKFFVEALDWLDEQSPTRSR